jgi:outer membrane murein-binding lipoprotein Lpp
MCAWNRFTYIVTDLHSIFNPRDEKSTLLSRVSSLQAQQEALENRLDSISQTADNAMEREREAEDRLDAALSMHARQLTQRQV